MAWSTPPQLGALESAVMTALWSADDAMSVREVLSQVRRRPRLAYTTVMTVLHRMHKKGLVEREKQGRAFVYRPKFSREEWLGRQAARMLTADHADRAVLVAFLDSAERADPALVERLSKLIADKRGGQE